MMKYLSLFVSCLLLAGCITSLNERVSCPATAILAEFSKSVERSQKEPVKFEIDSINPVCIREGQNTIVDMRIRFTAIRPLKSFQQKQKFERSYFVAVLDPSGKILSRTNHLVAFDFTEKQTTKVCFQDLIETVPCNKDVTIYVGFNLDETEHKYLKNLRETAIAPSVQ